jgi:thiaminase
MLLGVVRLSRAYGHNADDMRTSKEHLTIMDYVNHLYHQQQQQPHKVSNTE